jgi:tetratricopeptide (TPR) repeat protein
MEDKKNKPGAEDMIHTPTLAKFYEEQGNYKKAVEVYEKLAEKKPDEFYEKKIKYLKTLIKDEKSLKYAEINRFLLDDEERRPFQLSSEANDKPAKNTIEMLLGARGELSQYLQDRFSELTMEQFCTLLASAVGKNRKLKDVKLSDLLNALERI